MKDRDNELKKSSRSGVKFKNVEEREKTFVRALGFVGVIGGGTEGVCDVKDGKIVRIRPLHYDWQYTREEIILEI